jgi:protein phosphatase
VSLRVQCPKCRVTCQVSEQQQGKAVKCGQCGQVFTVPAAAPPAKPCRLDIGSATTPGKVRTRNEDRFIVQHLTWSDPATYREIALVLVADGLGGHEAGDVAAAMVMSQVGSYLGAMLVSAVSGQLHDASPERLGTSIKDALEGANRNVFDKAQTEPAYKGMAATAAAVIVWDGQVLIGHVGDCRVYHQRADQLTQVTKDQTLVERMVELGTLTPEEAAAHPARNQVMQALGKARTVTPAAYRLTLAPGDCLVVASDGLHAHVDTRMLASAIRKTGYSADILANHLVELANQGGGTDNCTVVAVLGY